MKLSDYIQYDATDLADLVKAKQVLASELASCAVKLIAKVNPHINAVTEVYEHRANKADTLFHPKAPFAGVPFLMKDFGASEKNKKQEMGSRLTRGYVAPASSALTHYFKEAGLILLGRTTTPEFALSLSTESVAFGQTRNPWDLERLAGGSSGGAGAIVASGAVPMAHATDAAGSIRIPASACGLVGLKPSRGRVTSMPEGESVMGMNTQFVLCRSVRDAAAMLDAVAKPTAGDPFVIAGPHSFLQTLEQPLKKLRIAFCKHSWATEPDDKVDTEVAAYTEKTAQLLIDLGHEVEEATPHFDYQEYLSHLCVGWAYGFDTWLESLAEVMGNNIEDSLEPVTLSLYQFAKNLTIKDILKTESAYQQLRSLVGSFFQDYDLLLTPTLTQVPEPLGKYRQSLEGLSFKDFFRRCDEAAPHLPLANLTGQPAVSLPLWQSQSNLPIGMHLMGRFGDEATLLSLAKQLEETLPWKSRQLELMMRYAKD